MTIQVQGLESTLKVLQKIQPEVKKQFFKDAKKILKVAVDEAKSLYPAEDATKNNGSFPSGLSRAWAPGGRPLFPYSQSAAMQGVKIETSLSKKKDAVLTIIQKDGAASVIDYAGTKTVNRLGQALNGWAQKPRVMWRSYENNAGAIEAEMKQSVDEVMARINQLQKAVFL
tara:strand:- start:4784 stop:5296 length:513 start_codon:yes stop_codon:yes gene_type:complete